jgi:hypothetical protein
MCMRDADASIGRPSALHDGPSTAWHEPSCSVMLRSLSSCLGAVVLDSRVSRCKIRASFAVERGRAPRWEMHEVYT